jgi:mannose-6-phosphate isomerase-like protein (cupin superfamily)
MTDFHNKLVKKPWGEEYLLYENENVALWHLKIKEGFSTSLHAHPNKKTGLVVLQGAAKVSFLNGENRLFPAEKIMIRQGVFHKTTAVVGDVELIEIETPKDKLDLVRLEDNYGRAGQPYEDESHYSQSSLTELKEPKLMGDNCIHYPLGKCIGRMVELRYPFKNGSHAKPYSSIYDDFTYVILKGHIKSGELIVAGPGDVSYGKNLIQMLEKFSTDNDILVLTLQC